MTITRLSLSQYVSVKEFAEMNGISKVSVYKALSRGRIDGRKIGNTWVIPRNAVIRDSRIKHGRMIGLRAAMRGDIDGFLKAQNHYKGDK
jgi:excisionase family DNA binding protein